MMSVAENRFESRLCCLESEVEGEKALTRRLFKRASRSVGKIGAIRVGITTLGLQAERAAGNVEFVKTMQASQGTILNILAQDMREICQEIGQMQAQMGEMRMEMGDTCTEFGNMRVEMGGIHIEVTDTRTEMAEIRVEIGETQARLDAIEKNVDAKFEAMQRHFEAVLAAVRTIAPHAPPRP